MKLRLTSPLGPSIAVFTAAALIAYVVPLPAYAGEPASEAAQVGAGGAVENMQVSFSSGVVTITYDLAPSEGSSTYDVTLEVSTNGGQTYDVRPRSASGDIGAPVPAGRGKKIVWEFAKDVETVQTNQFRFRVVIEVETRGAGTASPPEAPAQGRPGGPPSPGVTAPAGQAAGNPLLWPGLAVLGAGGALAGLAGGGSLRKRTDFAGFYELSPNKPVMYGGIGVAAAGLTLLLLGRRGAPNATLLVPIPGGVMVVRRGTF